MNTSRPETCDTQIFPPFSACFGLPMASRKESGSASSAAMASSSGTLDSPVKQIQIEGMVGSTSVVFLEKTLFLLDRTRILATASTWRLDATKPMLANAFKCFEMLLFL